MLSKGNLFPEHLVKELITKVQGHSSLAKLSAQSPISFNGNRIFTFGLDKEADIVAENGKKTPGGATITPITIQPIKMEYSTRVSAEFLNASEEEQIDILSQFADGAAKKFARALDLAAMHGVNPRTNAASTIVGDNCFDKKVSNTVDFTETTADDNLDAAISLVNGSEAENNGIALSPEFAAAMGKIKANGIALYPEFRFGGKPASFAGVNSDVNSTVSKKASDGTDTDYAIVGDFANMFRWGYAKEVPLDIIKYGNPDNDDTQGDLAGRNQILLRTELYIGWGILDGNAFARIKKTGA